MWLKRIRDKVDPDQYKGLYNEINRCLRYLKSIGADSDDEESNGETDEDGDGDEDDDVNFDYASDQEEDEKKEVMEEDGGSSDGAEYTPDFELLFHCYNIFAITRRGQPVTILEEVERGWFKLANDSKNGPKERVPYSEKDFRELLQHDVMVYHSYSGGDHRYSFNHLLKRSIYND